MSVVEDKVKGDEVEVEEDTHIMTIIDIIIK